VNYLNQELTNLGQCLVSRNNSLLICSHAHLFIYCLRLRFALLRSCNRGKTKICAISTLHRESAGTLLSPRISHSPLPCYTLRSSDVSVLQSLVLRVTFLFFTGALLSVWDFNPCRARNTHLPMLCLRSANSTPFFHNATFVRR
jgi:hypothetical protein